MPFEPCSCILSCALHGGADDLHDAAGVALAVLKRIDASDVEREIARNALMAAITLGNPASTEAVRATARRVLNAAMQAVPR